jgi:hypothetical protein
MYFQGDKVRYTGAKFARELSGKGKIGEVCARVAGQEGAVVVNFGDDDYVVSERSLEPYRPSAKDLMEAETPEQETPKKKKHETVVVKRRKRAAASDEES